MSSRRARLRRLFPPSGAAYELFDCAVFVAVVVGVTYVIEKPQPVQEETLDFIDKALDLSTWGSVLTACALAAVVCSYIPRLVSCGYGLLVAGCVFWAGAFIVGVLFHDGDPQALVAALIYLWVARRLVSTKARGA